MLLGVQLLVAAFAGLMWGIVVASVDTAVKWWEALAAVGTCATALLAIAIPWWQNWRRDIDERRAQLPHKWAAAAAAEQMLKTTQDALAIWSAQVAPVAAMFDTIRSTAAMMTSRIDDSVGVQILDDIGVMASSLIHHIGTRESGGAAMPSNMESIRAKVDILMATLQSWKQNVCDEYHQLQMTPPN
jgi:hypothetical protein